MIIDFISFLLGAGFSLTCVLALYGLAAIIKSSAARPKRKSKSQAKRKVNKVGLGKKVWNFFFY